MFAPTPLRRTLAAALRDLKSAKPAVRASAAHDLLTVGDESPREAADALVPCLRDVDPDVRSNALAALGALDARHLLDDIVGCLDDQEPTVRQRAVMALSDVGGARAESLVREALTHPQPDVRFQALVGVCNLDPAEGHARSLELLDDPDPFLAAEAADQLGLILTAEAVAPATFSDPVRTSTREALARHLDDPRPGVSLRAAVSLLRLGDPRGMPRVVAFLRSRETIEGDPVALTHECLTLLGTMPEAFHPAARDVLAPIARRWLKTEARERARAALERLGGRP